MPYISLGDFGLHVEQSGSGFPLILISGVTGLAQQWREQAPFLADSFSVVLHDQRGVGASDPGSPTCSIEQMAADVVALMDALDIRRAHLVGHATGGSVAQCIAIDHPKRVAALAVISGWAKPDAYFRRLFLNRRRILEGLGPLAFLENASLNLFPADWIAANDAALAVQEAQYAATFPGVETMLHRIDAVLGFDRSSELSRIAAPTLVMTAADDAVVPLYLVQALTRAIPRAELKIFPSGGHGFSRLYPREFCHAILPFLRAHTPAV